MGWSFADHAWWTQTAENQGRGNWKKANKTVAIADPDEWDDEKKGEGVLREELQRRTTDGEDIQNDEKTVAKPIHDIPCQDGCCRAESVRICSRKGGERRTCLFGASVDYVAFARKENRSLLLRRFRCI